MMLKLKPVFANSSLQSIRQSAPRFMSSRTSTPDEVTRATTVDASEVELFTKHAEAWWDPNGPLKGLHSYNKLRVPYFIGDWLSNPEILTSGKNKLLDVGCGGGLLSEALAKYGVAVTGIDVCEELITVAAQHCKTNQELKIKPTYYFTTIEEHAKKYQNYYDRVVASEVIDHITNKDLFVKSCVEVLKPGGNIFFSCPSKTRISQVVHIVFGENVMNNPPKGAHHYNKFISSEDLCLMLENNGCKVEDVKGVAVNLITNTWKWTRSKNYFYAVRAVKIK